MQSAAESDILRKRFSLVLVSLGGTAEEIESMIFYTTKKCVKRVSARAVKSSTSTYQ